MAKTRSEDWFAKGLKFGAIAGGLFFGVAALLAVGPIGAVLIHAVLVAIVGAVLAGAAGGVLGGVMGLFYKKDNGTCSVDSAAACAPSRGMPQDLQPGRDMSQQPSNYHQNLVSASRQNGQVQGM